MKITQLIMFKGAFIILLLAALAYGYTTKYDNIDLDEILANQRLYKKYFDCLTDKGKCTPDGKELKDSLPDALKNSCKECSEKQREGSEKVIRYVLEKKPEDFKILEKIYDADGIYRKKYEAEAEKRGIKLPS